MIKEKLEALVQNIRKHKVKTIAALSLAGLIAFTSLKNNVHFGAVKLHNPDKNHYAWGILPEIEIEGKAKGSFYSLGLVAGVNRAGDNSAITGDMRGYSLIIGANNLGNNSTITGNLVSRGLIAVSPMRTNLGTNVELGLENYIHKTKEDKDISKK